MKKLFLFFIAACFTTGIFSQTLFTYGNNVVSKDEFLRAYSKNKTAEIDKPMALREYLDLYIKFKLKVRAAKDVRIDTLASLENDLQNFRSQIEESYLNDESQVIGLVQEAFNRSQKDIHTAYTFFPFKDSDTLEAFKSAQLVYQLSNSVNPNIKRDSVNAINPNNLGYITVFNLHYEFENIVYSLKPGKSSKPYRTKNGYYIFKNIAERKAVGKIKAAQILIAVPEDAKEAERINAAKIADSVHKALQAGADFYGAAKNISHDQVTYMSGGVMPEFGVGKYSPEFENQVFSLQKDGDITTPFQTKFGYHIVKRISKTDIPDNRNDETYLYTLKQQVLLDSRIKAANEKFLNGVLKKLNYKKNTAIKENDLWKVTDSFVVANKMISLPALNASTNLFFISNQNIKLSAWLAFIKDYKVAALNHGESNREIMNKFISKIALDNYKKRLPDLNAEFSYQLQEFKDGNMLFEVMERNVWTKASNDSIGLKKYYDQHKTKYTWNASADAILLSASNEKAAAHLIEDIKKGRYWKQVAEEHAAEVQTDSGRYELTQLPVKPDTKFTEGMITDPLINENDGTATFVKVLKIYPANQQRNFDEARGLVINDYQTFLEEKWIQQLKKKYPVKVNEKVFQSLL